MSGHVPYRPLIGVMGAGQLGRMLALAGVPMGMRFRFLDPAPASPASELGEQIVADYGDDDALRRFAHGLDAATYEFENVPADAARRLAELLPTPAGPALYPNPAALETAQDRVSEKSLFNRLGIPTPPWRAVNTLGELQSAAAEIGLPAVLKTRRLGYDGKGQAVLRESGELATAFELLAGGLLAGGKHEAGLILEGFVPFERELSVIIARGRAGRRGGHERACYPLVENTHRGGILRLSIAPAADVTPALQHEAEQYAGAVADALDYVGVLTIEFFQHRGRLLANEMAPRVHNSGHWTIEGMGGVGASQFANHVRAVAGLPLGLTQTPISSAMINLIGWSPSEAQARALLAIAGVHLHLYGKEPRTGRKVGHVTVCHENRRVLLAHVEQAQAIIGSDG